MSDTSLLSAGEDSVEKSIKGIFSIAYNAHMIIKTVRYGKS